MPPSSALRRAAPLLAVNFVHRAASIALSLLPALFVDREAAVAVAAVGMAVARGGGVAGNLLSGLVADRFGLRTTLGLAFGLTASGVLAMVPEPGGAASLALLISGAAVAQVGLGMVPPTLRLLLTALVPVEDQREGLAWQRTSSNLGLVVSFSMGWLLGRHVAALLLLDAASSLAALALSRRLPDAPTAAYAPKAGGASVVGPFVWMTAIVCGWNVAYEAFLTVTAAQLRASLGEDGVSWYSAVMVLNVIGCGLLAVVVARRLDDPRLSVPGGLALLLVGSAIGVSSPGSPGLAAAGVAVVTAGELVFMATAQYAWMVLLPASSRPATVFSIAMTATSLGRALGGALAFALIVEATRPEVVMALVVAPTLALALAAGRVWRAADAVGGVR